MTKDGKKVLVTGGSGYMGLHVVQQFLENGYSVNTTTRNLKSDRSKPLFQLAEKYPDQLKIFEACLLIENSFLEAMQDVNAVVHVATPVVINSENPYQDMVKPAVEGTRNVLETCLKVPSVKKIVVTSSSAAVFPTNPEPNYVYSEIDFNKVSTVESDPYYYSKTQAELLVWEFNKKHNGRFKVVTLCPCFCFGPNFSLDKQPFSIDDDSRNNTGLNIVKAWIKNGTETCIRNGLTAVDIRDVALAHFRAVSMEHVEGRFLLFNEAIDWTRFKKFIVDGTNLNLEDLKQDVTTWGSGVIPKFDNTKSKQILELNYRPLNSSIIDTVKQLKEYQ